VLLVTSTPAEEQVCRLRGALEARGADVGLFDPSRFPEDVRLSVAFEGGERRTALELPECVVDLARVSAVWWQRPLPPQTPALVPPEQREWAARQASALLDGIWDGLEALWVPGPRRVAEAADGKVRQLEVAQRLGLRVPRTLVTNDPARALAFYDACEGRVVSKALRSGGAVRDGEKHLAYTHAVRRRDLQRLAGVERAPVIFQEQVPKRLELRVTVVGQRAFTAAIDSQSSPFARDDLRRADDLVACDAHELAPEVEALCLRLVQALGLAFGAIDLVLTPEGAHVFLEVNASGQWAWVETRAGLPITAALADLMVGASAQRV
jgi:hypothetical protein